MLVVSAVRLVVAGKKIFSGLQFLRFQSVASLADFTPYDSDSGPEDLNYSLTDSYVVTDYRNDGENHFSELNLFQIVEIIRGLRREPISALSFFKQLEERGFRHGKETYLALIYVLCFCGLDRKLNSLMLEVIKLEKERDDFKVLELMEAMVEGIQFEGLYSLVRAFDALVKGYVSLSMFDGAIDTIYEMKKYDIGPSLYLCNFFMNGLMKHAEVDAVIAMYKQELKTLGLRPNVYTFGIVVKAYCLEGSFNEAFDVFVEMKKVGVTPNAFTCSTLIEGLCMRGMSELGYEILLSWRAENFQLDDYAYISLIRGFVKEKKLGEAEGVLIDMEEQGQVPNEFSYSPLIHSYCGSGNINKALALHDKLVEKGLKTNCFIVASILQCLCRIGMPHKAVEKFFNFMKSGIFLDEVAFNVAIDALGKMRKLNQARELFDMMKGKKLIPDVVHYTTLINSCCLYEQIPHAKSLLEEMKQMGLKPDFITYNVLAGGLSRNGLLKDVHSLLDDMKRQGLTPSFVTHNMIIEGLCSGRYVKEAEKYFKNLEDKSLENYASMVNGYCDKNMATLAYEFFLISVKRQVLIEKSSCLKLLSSLCLERKYDLAIKLLEEMMLSSVDGTCKKMFRTLISSLCHTGNMEKAQWVFDNITGKGLSPDVISYTIMMNGYFQVNCIQEALDLFNDMKERNISPDIITYTVMLDGYSKVNLKRTQSQAYTKTLWSEMKEMSLKPDVICYTALINSLCKSGSLQDAISLFHEMLEQGLQPDAVTYTTLLSGCYKRGYVDKTLAIINEMTSKGIKPNLCNFIF